MIFIWVGQRLCTLHNVAVLLRQVADVAQLFSSCTCIVLGEVAYKILQEFHENQLKFRSVVIFSRWKKVD